MKIEQGCSRFSRRAAGALAGLLALASLAAQAAETASAKLRINLRETPDLGSRITAILDRDDRVEILESAGEFVKVRKTSGSVGYVKRKYLQGLADAGPAPAEAATSIMPPPTPVPPSAAVPAPSVTPVPVAPPVKPESAPEPMTASVAASPAATAAAPPARSRWYARAMGGVGFATESPYHIQQALNAAGGTVTLHKLDLTVPVFGLDAGYRFLPHFSVEGGVLDLGAYQGVVEASGADPAKLGSVLSRHYPGGGLGADLKLGAAGSLDRWIFGGAAGGFCSFDNDTTFHIGTTTLDVSHPACAPLLAATIETALGANFSVGLAANAVFFDDRQFTMGVTLRYR